MGLPINPLALMGRMAPNAGLPMAGPGGPAGANPAAIGQQIAQQLAQVGSSDPDAIIKMLDQMYQQAVNLIPQTAQRIPGVAQHMSSVMKSLQAAKDAASKAKQVLETVGGGPTAFKSPALAFSAANRTAGIPGGPQPGVGGM